MSKDSIKTKRETTSLFSDCLFFSEKCIHYMLFSLLAIMILFSAINIIYPHFIWHHFVYEDYSLHASVEIAGAIAAILMAFMPFEIIFGETKPSYFFISLGFLLMGIWDLFHSTHSIGHGFVASHSIALLTGGLFFTLIIFPWRFKLESKQKYLLLIGLVATIILVISSLLDLSFYPNMLNNGKFTYTAEIINLIAGALFLLSSIKLLKIYIIDKNLGVLILIFITVSSSIVGLTFHYSEVWTDGWWLWHIIRLVAFVATLIYMLAQIQIVSKDLSTTQKKLHQQHIATQESEKKFRSLFEQMNEGFALHKSVFNKKGKAINYIYLEVNKTFEKFTGLKQENIINKKVTDIIPDIESDNSNLIERYGKVASSGINDSFELYFEPFDKWYSIRAFSPDKGYFATLFNDITEQKKTLLEIEKEKKYVSQIIDALPGLFYQISPEGKFVKWNKDFETISGYSSEEMKNISPLDLFEGDEKNKIGSNINKVFEKGQTFVEANLISKDGLKTAFLFSGKRVEIGNKPSLIGMGLDISARKKALAELQESEEKFRSLIKSISLPLCLVNEEGAIVYLNDRFISDIGYTLDDIPTLDDWWEKAYPDEEYRSWVLKTWEEEVEKAGKSGKDIKSVEYQVKCKDGKTRIMVIAGITIKDGFLATFIDVTEQKQAEIQIKEHLSNLERSNQELEQFAYVASHDLQEPLRMISSYTQLLERRYSDQLDQDAKDFINYAVDGASRMQRLINDLLDYSRVTTRGRDFLKLDLSGVLGIAISNLRHQINDSNALVTNDELPFAWGDESQIARVFQNIIANAIKFKSETRSHIHITSQVENGEVVISIKDNGIGIDPQYSDRVFVIFQRLHNKTDYPGTGIGLAICKRIIERHNGKIWFESEPGQGTTFYFTLNQSKNK